MNMTEQMKSIWEKRTPGLIDGEYYKCAAVLLPLVEAEGEYRILFEVRAGTLKTQPGEICLPGGAVELLESPEEAAVRETMEELLVERRQIEILAPLDRLLVPASLTVHPYLGVISDYRGTCSPKEVERVFTVPLSYFLEEEPRRHRTKIKTVPEEGFPYEWIPDGTDYEWRQGRYDILFYRYEEWVIWGMTAKILHSFAQMYKNEFQGFKNQE